MHDQAGRETAYRELMTVAERYLWASAVALWRYSYQIEGCIKLPEGSETDDLPPHVIRKRFLLQAENLLNALSKAGWQLADGVIDISFRTDVTGPLLTLAGKVVKPSQQLGTEARISLKVMREI